MAFGTLHVKSKLSTTCAYSMCVCACVLCMCVCVCLNSTHSPVCPGMALAHREEAEVWKVRAGDPALRVGAGAAGRGRFMAAVEEGEEEVIPRYAQQLRERVLPDMITLGSLSVEQVRATKRNIYVISYIHQHMSHVHYTLRLMDNTGCFASCPPAPHRHFCLCCASFFFK